jgi:hypothetical protein
MMPAGQIMERTMPMYDLAAIMVGAGHRLALPMEALAPAARAPHAPIVLGRGAGTKHRITRRGVQVGWRDVPTWRGRDAATHKAMLRSSARRAAGRWPG